MMSFPENAILTSSVTYLWALTQIATLYMWSWIKNCRLKIEKRLHIQTVKINRKLLYVVV